MEGYGFADATVAQLMIVPFTIDLKAICTNRYTKWEYLSDIP